MEIASKIQHLDSKTRTEVLHTLKTYALSKTGNSSNERKQLVAYIQGEAQLKEDTLKAFLGEKLPEYMLPTKYVMLDKMPLLPNGKINRNALSQLVPTSTTVKKSKTVPENDSSYVSQLTGIWEEIIGFTPIQPQDNFFEIGGDSILSIQIVARAKKQGISLKANDIFNYQTIEKIAEANDQVSTEITDVTQELIAIWEEALGFSPISPQDNFFEIGGDSILSIQIVARAKKQGISLKANDIFKHQTIAEFVQVVVTSETKNTSASLIGELSLFPIQQWFLKYHKVAPSHWNQAIRIDGIVGLAPQDMQAICTALITQHDALRLSFQEGAQGDWKGSFVPIASLDYFTHISIPENEETHIENSLNDTLNTIQQTMDITKGSLFKCIYITTQTSSSCVLLAHHLVIDAISWQFLTESVLQSIDQYTEDKKITLHESTTTTISAYRTHLDDLATQFKSEVPFWNAQYNAHSELLPDEKDTIYIEEQAIDQAEFVFTKVDTATLLKEASQAYHTTTEELLMAALLKTIGKWKPLDEITIGLERHGRDFENDAIDLSQTVGWFTAYFPLKFGQLQTSDIERLIIATKETYRTIPNGGMGYGELRYTHGALAHERYPDIVFNFLGNAYKASNSMTVTPLTKGLRDPKTERSYVWEINCLIKDECLHISWSYANALYTKEFIQDLLENYKSNLKLLLTHCTEENTGSYTSSDFPEAQLSQDDLDSLLNMIDD